MIISTADGALDISKANEETPIYRSLTRKSSQHLGLTNRDIIDSSTSLATDTQRVMKFWKSKAKEFITSYSEQEIPKIVALKQIIDRPSTAEQNIRSIKEQQMFLEKIRQRDERLKNMNGSRKKSVGYQKGPLNYDYEGKVIEIRTTKPKEKLGPLLTDNQ